MSLPRDQVLVIAHLARLQVDDEDVERYGRELAGILELVDQLNAVDVAGVSPMAHPLDMTQRLRDDVVTETNQRDALMAAAPAAADGLFLVPKVIE